MTQLHATTPLSSSTVTLISQLGHDFNNLFSVVLGGLSLLNDELRDEELDAELRAVLEDTLSATQDAAQVIEKLTAWAGRQITEPRATDLNLIAADVVERTRQALPPGIQLTLETTPDPALAWVDPDKLRQCLGMLLDNARQAIRTEGEIHLTTHPSDAPGITLTDSGEGMNPDFLKHCLFPYVTSRRDAGHRGLGLSVVQGFMRVSEGELTLDSQPGRGTRVRLEFTPPEGIAAGN